MCVTDRGTSWLEHSRLNESFYTENTSQNSNLSNKVCISQFLSPCAFFPPLKTTPKHMSVPHLAEGYVLGRGVNVLPESPLWSGHRKYSAQLHISRDLDESWNVQALSVPLLETTPQFLR